MSPVSKIRTPPSGGAFPLPDAAATERAGRTLGCALEAALGPGRAGAAADPDGAVIVGLAGGLGAGKTALARAALRALGVEGTVRSPTYTLAEPYETRIGPVWHLDLYRIADPGELEYVAVRDLVSESAACLVEWPERGARRAAGTRLPSLHRAGRRRARAPDRMEHRPRPGDWFPDARAGGARGDRRGRIRNLTSSIKYL